MFEGLTKERIPAALEALMFVTDESLKPEKMALALDISKEEVLEGLNALSQQLSDDKRGITLKEVAGGWRLFTKEEYSELLEHYVLSWDTRKLSAAAMETLAIVAYLQPVTRGAVASIRGVNSDSTLSTLIEKGLIREAGCSDAPGNPTLYATTKTFLEKFGLASPAGLPCLDDFAPDDATRLLIRERLNAQAAELSPEIVEAIARGDEVSEEEVKTGDMTDVLAGDLADSLVEAGEDCQLNSELAGAFAQASASVFGLVDKIDFNTLKFDTDDE